MSPRGGHPPRGIAAGHPLAYRPGGEGNGRRSLRGTFFGPRPEEREQSEGGQRKEE